MSEYSVDSAKYRTPFQKTTENSRCCHGVDEGRRLMLLVDQGPKYLSDRTVSNSLYLSLAVLSAHMLQCLPFPCRLLCTACASSRPCLPPRSWGRK